MDLCTEYYPYCNNIKRNNMHPETRITKHNCQLQNHLCSAPRVYLFMTIWNRLRSTSVTPTDCTNQHQNPTANSTTQKCSCKYVSLNQIHVTTSQQEGQRGQLEVQWRWMFCCFLKFKYSYAKIWDNVRCFEYKLPLCYQAVRVNFCFV